MLSNLHTGVSGKTRSWMTDGSLDPASGSEPPLLPLRQWVNLSSPWTLARNQSISAGISKEPLKVTKKEKKKEPLPIADIYQAFPNCQVLHSAIITTTIFRAVQGGRTILNVKVVTQSCPALCNTMDWSLPCSSVHGILQAWMLGWVAFPFSKGSSPPRDRTQVFLHCRQILDQLCH